MIRVYGVISDFSGKPLEGATIHFEDENFQPLYTAYTDKDGEYSLEVEDRTYIIFAVKDYAEKYLEYWHWNFKPKMDRRLEIKIDGIELYGMKAWSTQPTYPGLIAYVRPMSLQRWIKAGKPKGVAAIAPSLKEGDITATINGQPVAIRGFNKVNEFITHDSSLEAVLIHIDTGNVDVSEATLCLTLRDSETSEQGMGCLDLYQKC